MNIVRWLIGYMMSRKTLFLLAAGFSFLFSTTNAIIPYFTGQLIDFIEEHVLNGNLGVFGIIIGISIGILALQLLSHVFHACTFYYSDYFEGRVIQKLRRDVFIALQGQSHKYYDQHSTGDLLSRSTSDIQILWDLVFFIPFFGTAAITRAILILSFLFFISFQLGILGLLSLPVMIFLGLRFEKKYRKAVREARTQFGQLSRVLQENLDGANVSRAFAAEEKEKKRFNEENQKYFDLNLRARKMNAAFEPQLNILTGIVAASILIVGSFLVLDGIISLGMLVAAILYAGMFAAPVAQIAFLTTLIGQGKGAAERIIEILESTPEVFEDSDAIELPAGARGKIRLEQVNFAYSEEPVLKGINLTIPGGQSIAILGATGSGKSSLINLIPRFYEVNEGCVKIDGIDIRKLKLEKFRRRIGFVDQETFLFSKSVHDNIAFGHPDASKEDVITVAKMAIAHDFIMKMPQGYDTIVGERGVTLSGGQRQRISIARALLANPLIVILDDSLSSVDMKTEKKIVTATQALLKNRTSIIVTQRLSVLSYVDWIVIMDKGRIVEEGTHDELLNFEGIYKGLWETQQDGLVDLTKIPEIMEVDDSV
ncbi:MAG: ABC transporter ATP-binding protein [Candidatus Hodarchaeota archaeon]